MTIVTDAPTRATDAAGSTIDRRAWSGHWIGVLPQTPDHPLDLGVAAKPEGFSRTLFRREFTLEAVPAHAPARLVADSRYVLFVNGTEVGRGPIRSQPRRARFDAYDLAPLLRTGANTVTAIVTYYGSANAFWQPAVASGPLGTDANLVFEVDLGGEILATDDEWRVHRPEAWTVFPKNHLDGIPVDRVEAALIPEGWHETGFDDAAWLPATILRTDHIGGFGRSQPPTDPYGSLLERSIGALGGSDVHPVSITTSTVAVIEIPSPDRPTAVVLGAVDGQPRPTGDIRLPLTTTRGSGEWQHVVLDFGRVVAGYLTLDVTAPAGTIFDFHYREFPHDPLTPEAATAPGGGMRYIARGRNDRYEALELHGLRYIHVIVRGDESVSTTINELYVREYTYEWQGSARFESDDDELNTLYRAGVRTVQLNSFDAFTDCPTREQRSWVGDGVVHQLVHLTTNADWRLASNYIRLGDAPRSDGILPMSVAGDVEANHGYTIPDWSLHWIHGVHNLFRYTSDTSLIAASLPTVERILRWYADYVDEFGTISDVSEWNLVDWSSVFSTGRSSILTALWARALREFEEISLHVGNAGSARWAHELWESAREGYEAFWDESRGTYVDHILDGIQQPAASQAAGASAIVSGLAPRERWARIVETITDPEHVVIRSWIGAADGGYDIEKMAEQAQGVQRIDWNVHDEIVRAEPFFSYVVHDAVALAGRTDRLLEIMRSWSQFLQNGYDTFGECWGWGTPVHGWSATPTKDLVQHVLGVTPAEPGFASVRIAPRLASIHTVSATVPSPAGPISVDVADGRIRIDSPLPIVLDLEGQSPRELSAGRHELALGA
jgi:hypothetical protein